MTGGHNYPYGSDQPDAVSGPWHAVLAGVGEDLNVGFDQWMAEGNGWAYGGREFTVSVVRGTATPMDVNDNGVGTVPNVYADEDVLYRHFAVSGDDAVQRWAQARMVAALLNANQEKLESVAGERKALLEDFRTRNPGARFTDESAELREAFRTRRVRES